MLHILSNFQILSAVFKLGLLQNQNLSFIDKGFDQTPKRIFQVSILTQGTYPLAWPKKLWKSHKSVSTKSFLTFTIHPSRFFSVHQEVLDNFLSQNVHLHT